MTVPKAVELIAHLVKHHPQMTVGTGTLLDVEMARKCLDAGATFLTSPAFDLEIAQFAIKENVAMFPAAMTPTEVVTAWKAGADFIKVFPCEQIGGEKYIKALNAALPQIPLIAAGGVNQQTAAGFISSGACALGQRVVNRGKRVFRFWKADSPKSIAEIGNVPIDLRRRPVGIWKPAVTGTVYSVCTQATRAGNFLTQPARRLAS